MCALSPNLRKSRVRSTSIASGLALPARRITINLAFADLPKDCSHYDLAIALGLMVATGAIPPDALSGFTGFANSTSTFDSAGRRRRAGGH